MRLFIILFLGIYSNFVFGQEKENKVEDILINGENPPIFYNSTGLSLNEFIEENLKYPINGGCIEGKVFVSFIVTKEGGITEITIERGINKYADQCAIDVVKLLKFKPGKRGDKISDFKMILPIAFYL